MFSRLSAFARVFLFFVLILISITACGTPAAPSDPVNVAPVPTEIPSPTPIPEPITFDNVCNQFGQEIEIEGILHLPEEISCTSGGNPDWCTAQLLDTDRNGFITIGLNINPGKYNPPANYMADLPNPYDISDFKVQTGGGKLVGEGDLVKITGYVVSPLLGSTSGQEIDCSLESINSVEHVSGITVQGPEKLTKSNLLEAITNGWVIASISGNGLSNIDISLKPQVDFNLELSIEPGTVFESQSSGVQNMVLRHGTVVVLKPNIEISLELEVSCANMKLEQPSGNDAFVVSQGETSDDLLELINLPEFRFESGRVQQFSIWAITDNPALYDFTGITDEYGLGSGPTYDEVERMHSLFQIAGIDASKYQVFNQ